MGLHAYIPLEGGSIFDLLENDRQEREFWTGGYGAFNDMLNLLGKAAGYRMAPKGTENPFLCDVGGEKWRLRLEPRGYTLNPERIDGYWATCPDDPLVMLLQHHDNQGILMHCYAERLADRLAALRDRLPESDLGWAESPRIILDGMITCLRTSARVGRDIEFN